MAIPNSLKNYNTETSTAEAPRTIASAMARIDSLNERLSSAREQLSALSDQIGGPRGVSASTGRDNPPSVGAVGRLNEATETAHSQMSDIEGLLASIGRALG